MKKMLRRLRKREEGAVMVFVAILLVILVGFTALAIDFGMAYYQRQKLQTACDAAALAGAQGLATSEAEATKLAKQYMLDNGYSDIAANISVTFPSKTVNGKTVKAVKVDAIYDQDTALAKVFSISNLDVSCYATAYSDSKPDITEFPYLLYSISDSAELNLGGDKFVINGAVHANGSIKDMPADGTFGVGQLSYGSTLEVGGGYSVFYQGVLCDVHRKVSWGEQKVYSAANLTDPDNEYLFLVPKQVLYNSSGAAVSSFNASSVNKTYYKTAACKPEDAITIPQLPVENDIFKKEKFNTGDTPAEKAIKDIDKKCKEKVKTIKDNGAAAISAATTGSGYATSTNANDMISDQNGSIVINNFGSKSFTGVGSFSHKKSGGTMTTVVKGDGAQVAQIGGSSSSKYEYQNVVFLNTGTKGKENGFVFNQMSNASLGNVSSNDNLKIRNESLMDPAKLVIDGDIYVDGDLYLYYVTVNGNIYVTGNITAEGCCLNGFIGAKKNIKNTAKAVSIVSYSATNAQALSVFSEEGNIEMLGQDDKTQYMVGIIYAPKGNAQLNAKFKFYGNVIGNTVTNISKSLYADPLSAYTGNTGAVIKPSVDGEAGDILLIE